MADLDLTPWLDRISGMAEPELRMRTPPIVLREIEGIVELGLIKEGIVQPPAPAIYVLPLADDGDANAIAAGGWRQNVRETVGIVTAVSNVRSRGGLAAHDELRIIRRALKNALNNWIPDGCDEPAEWRRGRLLVFDNGKLLWQDQYETRFTDEA